MGLNNFQIVFEKPMPTYFPGENINGQLIVDLNSEKKMEKIKVMFKGIFARLTQVIYPNSCI